MNSVNESSEDQLSSDFWAAASKQYENKFEEFLYTVKESINGKRLLSDSEVKTITNYLRHVNSMPLETKQGLTEYING